MFLSVTPVDGGSVVRVRTFVDTKVAQSWILKVCMYCMYGCVYDVVKYTVYNIIYHLYNLMHSILIHTLSILILSTRVYVYVYIVCRLSVSRNLG